MPKTFVTLDVFTDTPFGGNPLAVVFDAEGLTPESMQSIAREFNLSETAFVFPPDGPENSHKVRIFTPVAELPFAGHPTIGTAIAIAEQLGEENLHLRFEEGIGVVPISVSTENDGARLAKLEVAQCPVHTTSNLANNLWAELLGLKEMDICPDDSGIGEWSCGAPFSFVPLTSLSALGQAFLNSHDWQKHLPKSPLTGAFVFTKQTNDVTVDIRARMFAPAHGIAEDPATGSAVAALAGWLVETENSKDGTHNWVIEQGVEMGRPSRLALEVDVKNRRITGVRVGGHAIAVSKGEITVS